jgi:SAM-dependent methyltransferase
MGLDPKYPADAYRGFRARVPDWFIGFSAAPYLKQAVDLVELQPGDCVCDAACGSGFNIARLVRAVGPNGLVIAVEDNPHLLGEAKKKARRRSWPNVRCVGSLDDAEQFERRPFDGIVVSYNPPIFLQRRDLLERAWELLKPGGRLAAVGGRCTTPVGRAVGPLVRIALKVVGHPQDWHYWTVHEPWKPLEELSVGGVSVEPHLGFEYVVWAETA